MERDTTWLLNTLSHTNDIDAFIKQNSDSFKILRLSDCLEHIMAEKNIKRGDVVHGCCLSEVYAYQILNGTRNPSREKLLCLLVAMKLDTSEAQRILKINGYAQLYARSKKDCIILYALENKLSVIELNIYLAKAGFPALSA